MTEDVPAPVPPPRPPITTGGPLAALVPQTLEDAFRLARALAAAGDMVPRHYQGKPDMILAAVLKGMEIGLAPMQALGSIAIVNGNSYVWGDALVAIAQRAGHRIDAWHEGSGESLCGVAVLVRGDTGQVVERRFTIAEAQRAGLLNKGGPWQQYTLRMLTVRARAWAIRDGAADALMGVAAADEAPFDQGAPPPSRARGGIVYRPVTPPPGESALVEREATPSSDAPTVTATIPEE